MHPIARKQRYTIIKETEKIVKSAKSVLFLRPGLNNGRLLCNRTMCLADHIYSVFGVPSSSYKEKGISIYR